MKHKIVLLLGLVFILGLPMHVSAQEKAKTNVSLVKQKGNTVAITLTSSKPFRMGGNVYVLYIGNKDLSHSRQSVNKGKGTLTFSINTEDFNALQEGAGMYLTYGRIKEDGAPMEELSKLKSNKCWSLGKFNHSMLTK